MSTEVNDLQTALNDAIRATLAEDNNFHGIVYVSYDNKDLGVSETNMPIYAGGY